MTEILRCRDCNYKPCICEDETGWAAHCQGCENQIGGVGYYDPCAATKEQAIQLWNHQNFICGNHCHYVMPYGFVPECGCAIHDVPPKNEAH